ncbi:MAG: FHA domain-containing protein [Salinivirgaceae bacterium]|nr:FHA domain-containing protein [Salinivirgaceae bacterium]
MKSRISIGRNPDNDIVVDSGFNTVSGHHATITRSGDNYVFEDHSTNGSYVNGQKVHNTTITLRHGDNIRLSNNFLLDWRQIDALIFNGQSTERANYATQYQQHSNNYEPDMNAKRAGYVGANYNAGMENNFKEPEKGRRDEPKCLNKFNWGAFMLPGIWGVINNHKWLFIVSFALNSSLKSGDETIITICAIAQLFLMALAGLCGNKWAWEKAGDISATDFDKNQQNWNIWGGTIGLILNVAVYMLVP